MTIKRGSIRATAEEIVGNRRSRRAGILLTGGAGFLGSHVAADLLARGYPLYLLVRRQKDVSAGQRVSRVFDWLGVTLKKPMSLCVVEGDLDIPNLGLDPTTYDHLASSVSEIVHCASDTSFAERKRHEIEKTNVENLDRLLRFASRSRCYFFHLVSTAYVAGTRSGVCAEELCGTETFTNVYEETKYRAERLARKRCEETAIRLNIYRPSIVYGHSRTGQTLRFNALYYPVRILSFFRDLYETDIRNGHAKGAQKMGVCLDGNGFAHLPIRIETTGADGINLIPIDYFTAAFTAIMEQAIDGSVFHIVNPKPKPVVDLIDYTQRFFRIKGVEAVCPKAFTAVPAKGLEILFHRYVAAYMPYMRDQRIFDNQKAAAILDRQHIVCPDFDYTLFSRCMRYALATDWGKGF